MSVDADIRGSAEPLAGLLDQAAQLVGAADEPRWSSGLSRLAERVRAASDTQTRREVVMDVLSLYAGMGSFNDLVLWDATGVRPEQAELDRLRQSIHEAATRARTGPDVRVAPDDLYAATARLADDLAAAGHDGWAQDLVDVMRAGTTGSEVVMGLRWVLTRLAESGEVDASTVTRVHGLAAEAERALRS